MSAPLTPPSLPHPNPSPATGEGLKFHSDNVPAARRLRRDETATEAVLWELIRARRLMGLKFRRQHPVGRFVLDFYSEALKVAIEIDGPIHHDPEQSAADADRQVMLEEQGIRFIRVPTRLVETDPSAVMDYLSETLSLLNGSPLPSRERGRG